MWSTNLPLGIQQPNGPDSAFYAAWPVRLCARVFGVRYYNTKGCWYGIAYARRGRLYWTSFTLLT